MVQHGTFVWFDSLHPSQQSVTLGRVFLGWTSTKLGLMCLARGDNPVMPVRLKHVALRSRVKHSTTEPLRSINMVRTELQIDCLFSPVFYENTCQCLCIALVKLPLNTGLCTLKQTRVVCVGGGVGGGLQMSSHYRWTFQLWNVMLFNWLLDKL